MNRPSTPPSQHDAADVSSQEWSQKRDDMSDMVLQVSTCKSPFSMPAHKRSKRHEEGPLESVCRWVVEHQIGLSMNLLMLHALTHLCFPRARQHTRKFFELSYYNPDSGEYRAGWNDACMVGYWIIVFTGLRAAVMDFVLAPFARRGGVKAVKHQIRFAEQAWLMIYCSVFWTLGMYIMVNSDYWLNTKELWTHWPNREIGGLRKWYTLVQYAFWIQQIIVINIEERRKDYWQMFIHHIITTGLIFTSYGYHQTKVGNMVLCTMDIVDIILPFAKCLKYLGYSTVCDIMFGVFLVIWFVTRHIIHPIICYSLWAESVEMITDGCYSGRNGVIKGPFPSPDRFQHLLEPFYDPEGVVCWDHGVKWGFLSALLFLQGILLLWFGMIVRVALKVLSGKEAEDTRSDDEGEDEELVEKLLHLDEALLPPLEEEVGVESINLKGRVSSASKNRYRKGSSTTAGVSSSLPDRKELLGRIGCDKGV